MLCSAFYVNFESFICDNVASRTFEWHDLQLSMVGVEWTMAFFNLNKNPLVYNWDRIVQTDVMLLLILSKLDLDKRRLINWKQDVEWANYLAM